MPFRKGEHLSHKLLRIVRLSFAVGVIAAPYEFFLKPMGKMPHAGENNLSRKLPSSVPASHIVFVMTVSNKADTVKHLTHHLRKRVNTLLRQLAPEILLDVQHHKFLRIRL